MATSRITGENNFMNFTTQPHKDRCHHMRPCLVTATEILNLFHTGRASVSCLSSKNKSFDLLSSSSSSSSSPPLSSPCGPLELLASDYILKNMREAEYFLCSTLSCPCSLRPRVQLILVDICHMLLAWSQTFVPCEYGEERQEQHPDSQIMLHKTHKNISIEKVIHQPLTIGEYCIDPILQAEMKARVVLNEIQRLETIIQTLTSRIMEAFYMCIAEKNKISSHHELGLSEDVCSKLNTFLIQRLQTTKSILLHAWMKSL